MTLPPTRDTTCAMLNLLFALALNLTPAAPVAVPFQDQEQEEEEKVALPDPEEVKAAVEAFELAFKKGKSGERKQAIEEFGELNDPEVVAWLAKGLKDKDNLVRAASVEALRWQKNPKALDALHQSLKRDKTMKKVDALHEALIKAIGQHASSESIDFLTDGALADAPREVTIARIYSLGNIRDTKSVEELMGMMTKTGRASKRGGASQPLMKQFAISLEVLTAEDHGQDENAWAKWWRANKKTFEVSEKAQVLPPKVARLWNSYWTAKAGEHDGQNFRKKKKDKDEGTSED